jgi:hypothetical protein
MTDTGNCSFVLSKANNMSKKIQTEIVINASKEKVWDILTNFSDYPGWNSFLVDVKGTLASGSRLTNTMRNGNKTYVFKPKVLQVIPYKYFDWIGNLFIKGIFDGHHYFEIEELTPTQVRLIHGEHFSDVLCGYILKKIGDATRNNFIKMNSAVKQLAETTNN